jgi:purine-nucleoside phosphorylase
MNVQMHQIQEAAVYLQQQGILQPEVGIVLGSGLSQLIKHIDVLVEIPYNKIPHFPVATVEFHSGKLIYGTIGNKQVLAMQGRFHYYEGYTMQQITLPVRVMKLLGIQYLLLSNAAGGINTTYKKGDLVLIDDHINLLPDNPLTGPNLDKFGPRFPDMSQPYSKELCSLLTSAAEETDIALKKGVYAAVQGPNLETRAEYRFLSVIGADLVGMSTVPEVITANHMQLPCAAVSVVTDECDPDNLQPVKIQEILEVAHKADAKLSEIFVNVIKSLQLKELI